MEMMNKLGMEVSAMGTRSRVTVLEQGKVTIPIGHIDRLTLRTQAGIMPLMQHPSSQLHHNRFLLSWIEEATVKCLQMC